MKQETIENNVIKVLFGELPWDTLQKYKSYDILKVLNKLEKEYPKIYRKRKKL